jgi:hypothetical protein
MINTKYISNCTTNDIDEIKIASLYFDKIEVISNVLYSIEPVPDDQQNEEKNIGVIKGITHFVTEEYQKHIEVLINEDIVEIQSGENKSEDKLWNTIDKTTENLLSSHPEFIFKESNIKKDVNGKTISSTLQLTNEARNIHYDFVGPLEIGSKLDIDFLYKYYGSLLSSFLLHISNGDQCLTSSDILNDFLRHCIKNEKLIELNNEIKTEEVNPSLIMNALKLAVPNISAFPFDEVLETREKAKSELLEFRNELETFQFNLQENYSLSEINFRSAEIVKHKLNPSLIDLKRKIEDLNLSLPKTILDEFKDPKSYTPLLGSFVGGIPAHITAMLSLGLISISTAYDYILKRKDVKRNGLYYLISLENKFGK